MSETITALCQKSICPYFYVTPHSDILIAEFSVFPFTRITFEVGVKSRVLRASHLRPDEAILG